MKNLLSISAIVALFLLSGCGEEKTSCRFDVQQDIDQGDFDAAISKLESSCKDAFNENDRLYNLAAAYMGKAGYGVSEVIKVMDEADNNDSSDTFTTFAKSISKNKKSDSLDLLGKAKGYFLRSLDPSSSDTDKLFNKYCSLASIDMDDPRISNACFYIGFDDIIRTSVTLTYLTKDLDQALEAIDSKNSDNVPLDMQASIDALAWATGAQMPNNSTITDSTVFINGIEYKHLIVDLNGSGILFYRLADKNAPSSTSSTLVTDGYCDSNGSTTACSGIENEDGSINDTTKTCYACPIVTDGNNSSTYADLLVETLNDGSDSILSISNDEDIEQSVQDFKKEITGSENGTVTIEDVIDYLNAKQN